MSRGAQFTNEEDQTLLKMRRDKATYQVIADRLGRPSTSIHNRLKRLQAQGVTIAPDRARLLVRDGGRGERKPRRCLCCNKDFPSAHAGNRLCNGCRTKSISPFAPAL